MNLFWRIKFLITRKAVWIDTDTGETETVKEDFCTAWALAGVHSHNWRWVKRWGKLPCGCVRNPLTRRLVLFAWECKKHHDMGDIMATDSCGCHCDAEDHCDDCHDYSERG